VTRAIEEQRAILKDKSADPLKRAEAIRYLIHLSAICISGLAKIFHATQIPRCRLVMACTLMHIADKMDDVAYRFRRA